MRGGLWSSFSVPARRNLEQVRAVLRRRAQAVRTDRRGRAWHARCRSTVRPGTADPASGRKRPRRNRCHSARSRNCLRRTAPAGHQAAVVAPVEAEPRPVLPGLVLQVRGLVEVLVVVDAEHFADPAGVAPMPLTCGSKKRAATLRHHHKRRKARGSSARWRGRHSRESSSWPTRSGR